MADKGCVSGLTVKPISLNEGARGGKGGSGAPVLRGEEVTPGKAKLETAGGVGERDVAERSTDLKLRLVDTVEVCTGAIANQVPIVTFRGEHNVPYLVLAISATP